MNDYEATYTAVVDGQDVGSSRCYFYRSEDGRYLLNRDFTLVFAPRKDPFVWSEYRIELWDPKFTVVCGSIPDPVTVDNPGLDRLRFREGSIDLKLKSSTRAKIDQ